jgi:hypothetical protein
MMGVNGFSCAYQSTCVYTHAWSLISTCRISVWLWRAWEGRKPSFSQLAAAEMSNSERALQKKFLPTVFSASESLQTGMGLSHQDDWHDTQEEEISSFQPHKGD